MAFAGEGPLLTLLSDSLWPKAMFQRSLCAHRPASTSATTR